MNSDIVIAMDESEDHEPGVATIETGIGNVAEGGEIGEQRLSVLEKVVVEEEGDDRTCEGGDVMVEVLGSDVLFDVDRRDNGEVGSGGGDYGGKRENLGDVNDRDEAAAGGEVHASAPAYDSTCRSDISLDGNDGLGDGESHDVDKETVVKSVIERDLERKADDVGGVTGMELVGSGNELHEDSVSENVDVRSNSEIENGVQHCTSYITSLADGNRDMNATEVVDAVKEDIEDESVKSVKCDSLVSELRLKEGFVAEEGDEVGEVAGNPASGLINSPKQDEAEESEGHGQLLLPDESFVEVVDQGIGMPDTLLVDTSAMEGQEVHEDADICEQVESPGLQEDEEPVSDSTEPRSNDENKECEGHTSHGQSHLLEQSFVEDVDLENKHTPEASLVDETAMVGFVEVGSDMEDSEEVEEETEMAEQVESPYELEEDEEPVFDLKKPQSKEDENARWTYANANAKIGNVVKDQRVSYHLPQENEGEFSVFDLVWGKVKSHPWWPGQIFRPSDSSEKAKKYFKKDCYLVAYFGDRSFAWNDGSVLKPFFKHFSQEEKQSNSESFQNAVTCALEEVSRRVELGLACSCISEEVYEKIKYQSVENAGICDESSKREGVDWSTGVDSFEPDKLIKYVRALALSPTIEASRLDLVMMKAQLLAFNRLKGCDALANFQHYDGLMECGADTSFPAEDAEMELVDSVAEGDSKTRSKGPHKRKHDLKDIVYQRRKEKTLTELMGETIYYFDGDFDSPEEDNNLLCSPTSGTNRKASQYLADEFTKKSTKTISVAKVSHAASPNPQQSFKVGECIRRVASQLTGSSSIMKVTSDESNIKSLADDADEVSDHADDSLTEEIPVPKKEASTEEMLSQLHLSARDPMKGYSFLSDMVRFFSEFRNLAVSVQRQKMRKAPGRKRKSSVPVTGASGTFEFDDRNDSYWTDMVVQNNAEAKPSKRGRKRKEVRPLSGDLEKPLKSNPRKYSRKQYFHGNHDSSADIPSGNEKQLDQLPTGPMDLVLNFNGAGSIPSEANLNKMFRRFGPLKESETEVDLQNSRAKVVFKKRSDAEVAFSSATMFNIFGSTHVNYQLNYTPPISTETAPPALTEGQEDAT